MHEKMPYYYGKKNKNTDSRQSQWDITIKFPVSNDAQKATVLLVPEECRFNAIPVGYINSAQSIVFLRDEYKNLTRLDQIFF
mmetsp:Transcript_16402/g.20281  ORF Transcript_16402/g.20281 Transcript_16402/m.20281 type:complete len:82 (+) Transcript_16402:78-323(+)